MTAKFLDQEETCVTEIQGLVGNELMAEPHKAIAQAYIEYRHDRDIAHGRFSKLNQEIQGLVQKSNAELLNENTNKDTQVFAIKEGLNRNPRFQLRRQATRSGMRFETDVSRHPQHPQFGI